MTRVTQGARLVLTAARCAVGALPIDPKFIVAAETDQVAADDVLEHAEIGFGRT